MSKALKIADKFGNLFNTGTLAIKDDSNIAIGPNAKNAASTNSQLQITGDTAFVTNKDSSLANMYIGTTKYTRSESIQYILFGESTMLPANFVISGKFTLINKVGDLSIRTIDVQLSRTLGGYENTKLSGHIDNLEHLVTLDVGAIENANGTIGFDLVKSCLALRINVKADQQFDIFFEGYISNLFINNTTDNSYSYDKKLFNVTASTTTTNEAIFTASSSPYQQLKNISTENRLDSAFVELLDGDILIIGGTNFTGAYTGGNIYSNKVYRYNPVSQITREVAPLPSVFWNGNFFRKSDGKIIGMLGNTRIYDPTYGTVPNKNIYEFDPKTDIWTQVGTINIPGRFESAIARTNKKDVFLIIGGTTSDGTLTNTNEIYEFDANTKAFSRHPDLPFEKFAYSPNTQGITTAIIAQYVDSGNEVFLLFTYKNSVKAYFYDVNKRTFRPTSVPSNITIDTASLNRARSASAPDGYLAKNGVDIRIFGMAETLLTAEAIATNTTVSQKAVMLVFESDKEYWKIGQTLALPEMYTDARILTLKDDTLLVNIGVSKNAVYTSALYKYFPRNDAFIALTKNNKHRQVAPYPIIVQRTNFGVSDFNGNVYVFGGTTSAALGAVLTTQCFKYISSTDTWTAIATFPAAYLDGATSRFNIGDALLNRNKICCIGGNGGGTGTGKMTTSVAVYDIPSNTWEAKGVLLPVGEAFTNGTPANLSSDEILFATTSATAAGKLFVYKYSTNTVTRYPVDLPDYPNARTFHMKMISYGGFVYAFGGYNILDGVSASKLYRLNTTTKVWELYFTFPFIIHAPSISLINNGPEAFIHIYNSITVIFNIETKTLVSAPSSSDLGIVCPLPGRNILVSDSATELTNKMAILTLNFYNPVKDLTKVPLTYANGSSGKLAPNSTIINNTLVSYGADNVPNAPALIDLNTRVITRKAVRSSGPIQIDAALCPIEKTNSILVIGGRNAPILDISNDGNKVTNKIYEYNTVTDVWTEITPGMPTPAYGSTIVQIPNTLDFYVLFGIFTSGTGVGPSTSCAKLTLTGTPGNYSATVSNFGAPIGLQFGTASLADNGRIVFSGGRKVSSIVAEPYGVTSNLEDRKFVHYYDYVNNVWSIESKANNELLRDAIFANNTFLISNIQGGIKTSTNGVDWSTIVNSAPTAGVSLAYGNGIYVSVGTLGEICYSNDAVNWTSIPPVGASLTSVYFANNLFVAGGGGGALYTSPDGVNWTQRTTNITGYIYGIVYNSGLWVVCSTEGKILTSPDTITWTSRTTNTTNDLYGVTYLNGQYLCVGTDAYLTSPDGVTWTKKTSINVSTLYRVTFRNSLYIAIGYNGLIYTSVDANAWTLRANGLTTKNLYGIAYGNGKFIVSGFGVLLTSTDGITWTKIYSNYIVQPDIPNSTISSDTAMSSVMLDDSESLLFFNTDYYAVVNVYDGTETVPPKRYSNSDLVNNLIGTPATSLPGTGKARGSLGKDGKVYILTSKVADNADNELYVFS